MPPWCTCLFCIAWLGNVQRFITRAKPLHDSLLNPFISDVFAAVVVCARSLHAVVVCKKSRCRLKLTVFCLLLYLWFKFRSHWKIPDEQLLSSTLEKDCTICLWKFPEIRPGIFDRMVSAHGHRRAYRKTVFLARSPYNKSASLDLTSFSLKCSSKCALKSLKRRGLARLASVRRPNCNGSTILFSQIYPWDSDLLLPRKM